MTYRDGVGRAVLSPLATVARLSMHREALIIDRHDPWGFHRHGSRDLSYANSVKAVLSALADVHRAVPSAKLIEVAPDLVGLTDVAEIVGVSRQNMRKLMLAHPSSFPTPVHEGSASIWHLSDVLTWLQARGSYSLTKNVLDVAQVALRVNAAKEGRRLPGLASKELAALVG